MNKLLKLLLLYAITGCTNSPQSAADKYASVLAHFANDSLKLKAARFIIDNLPDHYAVVTRYEDKNQQDQLAAMVYYHGPDAGKFRDSLGVSVITDTLYDSVTISPAFLIKDIEQAFQHYQENPLAREVPFDIFCEYLLPYRVGTEKLNEWREYDHKRYSNVFMPLDKRDISDSLFIKHMITEQEMWFFYEDAKRNIYYKPAENQTIREMLTFKTPYSCEDYAVHYLYAFRSLGVPSAYEIIPFLGKFNSGHAETCLFFSNGSFRNPGDTLSRLYQIAKMYRRTFSRQPNPFNAMQEAGEAANDIPAYFNNDHLIDITHERTTVSDVYAKSELPHKKKVAYLCVYNGGTWQAVEWGKYDTVRQSYHFSNMGRKILYQLVYASNGNLSPNNPPFILDSTGNVSYLNGGIPSGNTVLLKFDRHHDVQPDKEYILYAWNNKKWGETGRKLSKSNGVVFPLTGNQLYKLEESGYEGEAVRPFTIQNGKQVWW